MNDFHARAAAAKADKLVEFLREDALKRYGKRLSDPGVAEWMIRGLEKWTPKQWAAVGKQAGFSKPPETSIPLVFERLRELAAPPAEIDELDPADVTEDDQV